VEIEDSITLIDEGTSRSNKLISIDVILTTVTVDGLCDDTTNAHVLEAVSSGIELADNTSDLTVLRANEAELRVVPPCLLIRERTTSGDTRPLRRGSEAVNVMNAFDGHVHKIDLSEALNELCERNGKSEC